MALYRGNVKVSGIGQSFNPENTGTEGQVLTKTNSGYAYCDKFPSGGTEGQVLTKTASGEAWCNGGGGGDAGPKVDVIVVAGGGGGGGGAYGLAGGGGGGGVKECKQYHLEGNSISVVVGARGTLGSRNDYPTNGGDSCFGDIKACGGGNGCSYGKSASDGGNGGGGTVTYCIGSNRYTRPACGVDGGYEGGYNPGGGGGAGGPGCIAICGSYGGVGGIGYRSDIFCIGCLFSSGGSGGGSSTGQSVGHPGGGSCYYNGSSWGLGDATFYGGGGAGGGGSSCVAGTNGYQGVVMLRYPTDGSYGVCSSTGGNCCFTCDGYCYVEFTSDGTFCITG